MDDLSTGFDPYSVFDVYCTNRRRLFVQRIEQLTYENEQTGSHHLVIGATRFSLSGVCIRAKRCVLHHVGIHRPKAGAGADGR